MSKTKNPNAGPRKTAYLQIRIDRLTKAKLRARADLYADGNMSAWAEYCFENAPPRPPKHLLPLK